MFGLSGADDLTHFFGIELHRPPLPRAARRHYLSRRRAGRAGSTRGRGQAHPAAAIVRIAAIECSWLTFSFQPRTISTLSSSSASLVVRSYAHRPRPNARKWLGYASHATPASRGSVRCRTARGRQARVVQEVTSGQCQRGRLVIPHLAEGDGQRCERSTSIGQAASQASRFQTG